LWREVLVLIIGTDFAFPSLLDDAVGPIERANYVLMFVRSFYDQRLSVRIVASERQDNTGKICEVV